MTTVAGEVLVGTTGGSTFYPDQIMDAGFTGEIDFIEDYCRNYSPAYAGGAVVAGHIFKDLVDATGATGANVQVDVAGLSTKGLLLAGTGYVQLPDVFKIQAAESHFAIGMVLAIDPAAVYAANEAGYIAGWSYQNSSQCAWAVTYTADANGALQQIVFRSMALGVIIPVSAFADGKPKFCLLDVQVLSAAAPYSLKASVYIGGVLAGAQTAAGSYTGAFAAGGTSVPIIGCPTTSTTINGYQKCFRGSKGRIWIKRFGLDPDALLNTAASINARELAAYGADYA